jgi:outer membrane protein assembly factor BamB
MLRFILILSMLIGALCTSSLPIVEAAECWPMFRHDNMRTGYIEGTAPTTNNTLWVYRHDGPWIVTSAVVVDGRVIIGDEYLDLYANPNPHIYALNETTGELLWNFSFSGWPWTPAVFNGKVIFGTTQGSMYSLEATDGTVVWSKDLGDPIESSPTISEGTVYIGTLGGQVFALNQTSGDIIWQKGIGYECALSPALAYDTIFVEVWDHPNATLYALNKTTGSTEWGFNHTSFGFPRWWQAVPLTSPTVSDGKVYTGPDGLYCLNATSGKVIWQNTTISVWSSPSVSNGEVFIGGSTGSWDNKQYFYAFDQNTGELVWQHEFDDLNDVIFSSPAIAGGMIFMASHGHLYGSKRSYVYALNETNGRQVWAYDTTDEETMTSPAVSDGKLFVTTPHYLLVFGDNIPPSIDVPSHQPEPVMPNQNVTVYVNVTDADSGVRNVTLYYAVNNQTAWEEPVPMNYNTSTSLYEATIPSQAAGTWVQFKIVAYDYAGNFVTRNGIEPYCVYQVVSEFPSFIFLSLFMIATLLIGSFVALEFPCRKTTEAKYRCSTSN